MENKDARTIKFIVEPDIKSGATREGVEKIIRQVYPDLVVLNPRELAGEDIQNIVYSGSFNDFAELKARYQKEYKGIINNVEKYIMHEF